MIFTTSSGVTVTSDQGTVGAGMVTGIPSGTPVTLIAIYAGCVNDTVLIPAAICPECELPVLSLGQQNCDGTTYSLDLAVSSADTVTSTAGTVIGSSITGIPLGTDVTITASNGAGCETSMDITGPDTCPTDCNVPDLSVGQAVCDSIGSTTYTVSYTESTGAGIVVIGGTDNNDGTLSGTLGTAMTITASNGDCEVIVGVSSPVACDDPCANPPISIGGATCSGDSAYYAVIFTTSSGVTVTSDQGTVGAGMVTGIPSGTPVTLIAIYAGCVNDTVLIPAAICPECELPVLSLGQQSCDGTTYSLDLAVSSADTITATAGTVMGSSVVDIPLGTDVTIIAHNFIGCETSMDVTAPGTCPTDCNQPDLTVGQAVCDSIGAATYTVSYTESTGAGIVVIGGTDNNDGTLSGTLGTAMTITASNGDCEVIVGVSSPVACDDPCANPPISIGGVICSGDSAYYAVIFTTSSGVTVTSDQGTVGAGMVTGIPSGTPVTLIAIYAGCVNDTVLIPAAICPECELPVLSLGQQSCDGTTYSLDLAVSSADTVTSTAGTVIGSSITGIPLGTDVTITASNGAGCETSMDITGPDTCPTDCNVPDLSVGQAVCDSIGSTTYTVSYTESTGAGIVVIGGTDNNDGTLSGTLGTAMTITASNGDCEVIVGVSSPVACDDPCANPPISIGGVICSGDSAYYAVIFTTSSGVTVTSDQGTVGAGMVTGIPSGTPVTLIAIYAGCVNDTVLIPSGHLSGV